MGRECTKVPRIDGRVGELNNVRILSSSLYPASRDRPQCIICGGFTIHEAGLWKEWCLIVKIMGTCEALLSAGEPPCVSPRAQLISAEGSSRLHQRHLQISQVAQHRDVVFAGRRTGFKSIVCYLLLSFPYISPQSSYVHDLVSYSGCAYPFL
jgi:hypothetical protein